MPILTVRRSVAGLAALAVLAIVVVAALPWIASTQIVRDRIAYELSVWSGYRVSLGEAPELDVWPIFGATLNDVAFHEWSGGESPPVLEADSLRVEMSALAALRGNVVLSAVSMQRPVIRLTVPGSVIDLPASPGGGRMVRAVDAARGVIGSNPSKPDTSALPSDSFGTVEFTDGRVIAVTDDDAPVLSSLEGRITWPSLDRPASLTATGIWRGENIAVDASSTQPLMLLAGGNAQVQASIKSTLLTGSFSGTANFSGEAFFDGQASLASPSLRRMLEWSRTRIGPGRAIGAMSISSKVQGTAQRLKLDGVELSLGSDVGRGVLDLAFADSLPSISGTLAFDRLNVQSFLSAFSPMIGGNGSLRDRIDTDFADQIALDVRVSAGAATLGPVNLAEVAATAQVKAGLAVFDISDAAAFGGNVQAAVRVDRADERQSVEVRLMASDIEALSLARAIGQGTIMPEGRANISLILKGAGATWSSVLASAEGSLTASIGQGVLSGIDLPTFKDKWSSGGFFALSDATKGTLPFRGIDMKAAISRGVARIEKGDILLQTEAISLRGIVPYLGRALALSGYFTALAADGTRGDPEEEFFIGGAWNAPYVSPVGLTPPLE
jgi:AsmA protein